MGWPNSTSTGHKATTSQSDSPRASAGVGPFRGFAGSGVERVGDGGEVVAATPPKAALLHMELAPEFGGDTLWASPTRAYESLSPAVQSFFESLTFVHSKHGYLERVTEKAGKHADAIREAISRDYDPVEHPRVRTHPETSKRALLYAEGFVDHVAGVSRA